MAETVKSKGFMLDGKLTAFDIPVNNLEQTFTYDGQFPATCTIEYQGVTFVQTFTNNGSKVTNISNWEAQL